MNDSAPVTRRHPVPYGIVPGLLLLAATAGAAADPDLQAGNIGQFLGPAIGLGMTWLRDDAAGRPPWLENTASTLIATDALKFAFADTPLGTRPDGGSHSFPSGHTAAACSGAFFVAERYGWGSSVPTLLLAAFTGYSRVDEHQHFTRDVLAGCAVAYGSARYWVVPQEKKVSIVPLAGHRALAIAFGYRY